MQHITSSLELISNRQNTQHLGKKNKTNYGFSCRLCKHFNIAPFIYHTHCVASVPFSAAGSYIASLCVFKFNLTNTLAPASLLRKLQATDQLLHDWSSSCSYAVYSEYCSFLLIMDVSRHTYVIIFLLLLLLLLFNYYREFRV